MTDPARWAAFVPRQLVAGWGSADPLRAPRIPVVCLTVDIAGFTPLSERYAAAGPAGTERLSALLNAFFAPAVATIEQAGGSVAGFAGDALTALFEIGPDGPSAAGAAALRCATVLCADTTVAVKAGIGAGSVWVLLGSTGRRSAYALAGSALARAERMEKRAGPGEVLLDDRPPPAARRHPEPAGTPPGLDRYVHPTVVARLASSGEDRLAEHRPVTVVFARRHIGSAGDLVAFLHSALDAAERYDGLLSSVVGRGRRAEAMLVFGAPVAHGDDPARAVAAALAMRSGAGPTGRCGVNGGRAFCGLLGSPDRREYAVIADPVNVAARLAQQAAPGQVLVSESTRRAAGSAFAAEALPEVRLKGKERAVRVASAAGEVERSGLDGVGSASGPLLGRDRETAQLAAALAEAVTGSGASIAVSGEAGIGKSRLLAAVAEMATAAGAQVVGGAWDSWRGGTPYLGWRPLLRLLRSGGQAGRAGLRPLLDVAVGEAASAELDVDPAAGGELLDHLVVDLLRAAAAGRPHVVLLDDAQWMGPESRRLLHAVAAEVADAALLLVVAYRPEPGRPPPLARRSRRIREVRLSELDASAAAELVRHRAGAAADDTLVEAAYARAGGNPLFLGSIVELAMDARSGALPETLSATSLARIDRLPEADRSLTTLASVLGRRFTAAELAGSFPETGTVAQVDRRLSRLSRAGLTAARGRKAGSAYAFAHGAIQEAAYESLSVTTRETLHAAAGRWLESSVADPAELAEVLAHHFGRTPDLDRQRRYFALAGDRAAEAYAHESAAGHYGRLLAITGDPAVALKLGTAHELAGRWSEAETHYRAVADSGSALRGPALAALGALLAHRAASAEALVVLRAAERQAEADGDWATRSRVLDRSAWTAWRRSEYETATGFARQHLAAAQAHGDVLAMAMARQNLGLIASHTGRLAVASRELRLAVELAADAAVPHVLMLALNDLAGVAHQQGQTAEAMATLDRAEAVARRIGDRRKLGMVLGNRAELLRATGDPAGAIDAAMTGLAILSRIGDWPGVLVFLCTLSSALVETGRPTDAVAVAAYGVPAARATEQDFLLAELLTLLADAYLDLGRWAEVGAPCAEAEPLAAATGNPAAALRCRLLPLLAASAGGDLPPAAARAQVVAAAADRSEDATRELLDRALSRLGRLPGGPRPPEAPATAVTDLLHRLVADGLPGQPV